MDGGSTTTPEVSVTWYKVYSEIDKPSPTDMDQLRQMGPFPKPEELDRLLPWSDDLPDEFRTKNKR